MTTMLTTRYTESADGTAIAYETRGDGPTVIIVYGATVPSRHMCAGLVDELASDFTVVTYDRRGRGESSDNAVYAPEREVEDIAAVLDAVGRTASLVGHSSGAALALDAAAALDIESVIVYEPPFIVDDSRAPLPSDYVAHLQELTAAGDTAGIFDYFMTAAVGVSMPAQDVTMMQNSPFWDGFASVAHTVAYDGAIVAETMAGAPLPLQRWARVTMPTLVLAGGASHSHMRSGALALADLLPDSEYRVLDGQDHGVADDLFATEIRGFIDPYC